GIGLLCLQRRAAQESAGAAPHAIGGREARSGRPGDRAAAALTGNETLSSNTSQRSPRRRKQPGGGVAFLLALGIAMAGVAIGVHFSSSPPAGGGETGRHGDGG